MKTPRLYNRTRTSPSIDAKLRREGRWLELPLYHLLRQSDLGHEGLENSGSYRFADHIYRNAASGRGLMGLALDRALLALPAVRSFRNRYLAARDELTSFLIQPRTVGEEVHIISAPCGLPREMAEAACRAELVRPGCLKDVFFHGVDLDEKVLREAAAFAAQNGLPRFSVHHGDALNPRTYPAQADFITCTGLAEFLDDGQLEGLYATFHQVLKPGGYLFTSGMRRLALSDYLLELVELHTHYRMPDDLGRLARQAGFASPKVRLDRLHIQALMLARK